jgi:hypothetical protein
MKILGYIKTHQQIIILVIGYILVAGLAFGVGRISATSLTPPEIRVEEAFVPLNHTANIGAGQSGAITPPGPNPTPMPNPPAATPADCKPGQIKGNIGSGASRVYHIPGGSFYNRTKAEACFNTEAEAQAAGFRKSNT